MKAQAVGETLESMSQAVWYNQWTLGKFSKYLSGEILEIGCGIGNFTNSLIKFGDIWAIDINKDYIRETEILVNGQAKIGFGDIETGEYFFGKKTFDTIVCLNVLEHIRDDKKALNNIYELLKTGGKLILLVPSHPSFYGEIDKSIGHFRRYEKSRLLEILEFSGFKLELVRILNFLGAIGWYIFGKLFKNKSIEETKINIFNLISPAFLTIENFIEPPFGTSILVIAKKYK